MKDLREKSALVTGASSGLGLEMARQLAASGAHLILVARLREKLEALARELSASGVEVTVFAKDLGRPEAPAELLRELDERGARIDVLINNAGAGLRRYVIDSDWDAVRGQIQLNVTSLVELTHAVGGRMRERGEGHILNVASIGAYLRCRGSRPGWPSAPTWTLARIRSRRSSPSSCTSPCIAGSSVTPVESRGRSVLATNIEPQVTPRGSAPSPRRTTRGPRRPPRRP